MSAMCCVLYEEKEIWLPYDRVCVFIYFSPVTPHNPSSYVVSKKRCAVLRMWLPARRSYVGHNSASAVSVLLPPLSPR